MRILVCGDRDWKDEDHIYDVLAYSGISTLIEGEARGADKLSRKAAELIGDVRILPFPAKWKDETGNYRPWAGPERNKQMLDEGKPSIVWAFHNNITQSKGTKNMMNQAWKRNIAVVLHYVDQYGYRHDIVIDETNKDLIQ